RRRFTSTRGRDAVLASLPMYDLPELGAAHDAVWARIARSLEAAGVADVPSALAREGGCEPLWGHPELLFSQTCGYPLVTSHAGRLRVIATPTYDAPGCGIASYASMIVVPERSRATSLGDLRGAVCAVNERSSHSGMNALRAMLAPLAAGAPFFREVRMTGGRVGSVAAVQRGGADVCAVDAAPHALLARHRPGALAGTRVLGRSPGAPALPFVTRADAPEALVTALRAALAEALADPEL